MSQPSASAALRQQQLHSPAASTNAALSCVIMDAERSAACSPQSQPSSSRGLGIAPGAMGVGLGIPPMGVSMVGVGNALLPLSMPVRDPLGAVGAEPSNHQFHHHHSLQKQQLQLQHKYQHQQQQQQQQQAVAQPAAGVLNFELDPTVKRAEMDLDNGIPFQQAQLQSQFQPLPGPGTLPFHPNQSFGSFSSLEMHSLSNRSSSSTVNSSFSGLTGISGSLSLPLSADALLDEFKFPESKSSSSGGPNSPIISAGSSKHQAASFANTGASGSGGSNAQYSEEYLTDTRRTSVVSETSSLSHQFHNFNFFSSPALALGLASQEQQQAALQQLRRQSMTLAANARRSSITLQATQQPTISKKQRHASASLSALDKPDLSFLRSAPTSVPAVVHSTSAIIPMPHHHQQYSHQQNTSQQHHQNTGDDVTYPPLDSSQNVSVIGTSLRPTHIHLNAAPLVTTFNGVFSTSPTSSPSPRTPSNSIGQPGDGDWSPSGEASVKRTKSSKLKVSASAPALKGSNSNSGGEGSSADSNGGVVNRPRDFLCNVCGNRFLRKQDLNRHDATHAKTKPFTCPLGCGTCFGRSDALTRHLRSRKCSGVH
ncbi:hypothetical protein HDU84_002968 [Entophlyctis sp. JEL0112]|nr:hypothetical protein HDU84_002968 [Entophlyctis sp. JEL0112]